jgi:hypothetical protein
VRQQVARQVGLAGVGHVQQEHDIAALGVEEGGCRGQSTVRHLAAIDGDADVKPLLPLGQEVGFQQEGHAAAGCWVAQQVLGVWHAGRHVANGGCLAWMVAEACAVL